MLWSCLTIQCSLSLCSHPKHTILRRLIAEASQLTLRNVECVNKAMEGRSCSLQELDLKQSKFLFAVNWLPSQGAVYREDEVGVEQCIGVLMLLASYKIQKPTVLMYREHE